MIFGVGTDLVDMRRIEKVCKRFPDAFAARILSAAERNALSAAKRASPLLLAKRFAAKEACAKALGTGISQKIGWHDMGVIHGDGARPQMVLSERAHSYLRGQMRDQAHIQLDLSLSDEYPYVQAFVVLSYTLRRE